MLGQEPIRPVKNAVVIVGTIALGGGMLYAAWAVAVSSVTPELTKYLFSLFLLSIAVALLYLGFAGLAITLWDYFHRRAR